MTAQQSLLDWHAHKANQARHDFDRATCPIKRAELLSQIQWHTSEIRKLDLAAEAADRAELNLLRT